MPDESVQCVVTSPPYWGLRDYGVEGQLGLEATPEAYVERMVAVFREVRRVLRRDGTLWLNIGDSYAASGPAGGAGKQHTNVGSVGVPVRKPMGDCKPKDLVGIPWMLAFALRADGWWLRQDIIWAKPNPMPESVTDRCTKSHEYLFLLSKSRRYYYDADAIREAHAEPWRGQGEHESSNPHSERRDGDKRGLGRQPVFVPAVREYNPAGRNKRDVWTISTKPYAKAHFATFPPALVEPCVLAGTRPDDVVLDPFAGSGTTAMVARRLGRKAVSIELNAKYLVLAQERCGIPIVIGQDRD
jgi:DNA modification methylase